MYPDIGLESMSRTAGTLVAMADVTSEDFVYKILYFLLSLHDCRYQGLHKYARRLESS